MKVKLRLKNWLWLGYPLIVAGFIAVTANLVFSDPGRWVGVVQSRERIEEDEAKAAELRNKLLVLQAVDIEADEADLRLMAGAVPASKLAGAVALELREAASAAGAVLEQYRGSVGRVDEASGEVEVVLTGEEEFSLVVNYRVTDLEQLKRLLADLERRLPLVQVTALDYSPGRVEMTVEGVWKAWGEREEGELEPDYKLRATEVKLQLADFLRFEEVSLTEGGGGVSPF